MDEPVDVCRLAICDDVAAFRLLLATVLQNEPDIHVVGEATNGREAIDFVAGNAVDVMILDVAMPIMDGLEALPVIKRTSPHTKVIMLTGFGTDVIRARAMDGGACRYLEKGVSPLKVVDAVREVCGMRQPAATSTTH